MQIEQSYSALPIVLFSDATLVPVATPKLVIANDALAGELGLSRDWLHSDAALQMLCGNAAAPHG